MPLISATLVMICRRAASGSSTFTPTSSTFSPPSSSIKSPSCTFSPVCSIISPPSSVFIPPYSPFCSSCNSQLLSFVSISSPTKSSSFRQILSCGFGIMLLRNRMRMM
eukprot:Pompholyxophrys_sp_v1_NODE_155_length_1484_cov_20.723583.p3 type:complete len:108 gc:universal NODE_155_length_1484_cov_20.723583:1121-1444(+)